MEVMLKTVPISMANHYHAVTVAPVRARVRPQGANGDLTSLKRAQMRRTEKNLELSSNRPPVSPYLVLSQMLIFLMFRIIVVLIPLVRDWRGSCYL